MKALIYIEPEVLQYRDVPDPTPASGEVLIKVDSVGICGSDMHAFLGHDERRPAPLILGHEVAGTVTGGPRDGERVAVNPLVTCSACPFCTAGQDNLCTKRQIISMPPREGGFAEYIVMQERNLVGVPDNVAFSIAALAEPIACGWHAVRKAKAALYKKNDCIRTLVIGGGAIGIGAALSCSAQGMKDVVITEPNALRRKYIENHCALRAIDSEALRSKELFDLVVDGVGYETTRELASKHALPGGVIAHIGLGSAIGGLDIRRMTLQEITFFGTYTYTTQDFRDTAQAIFDGRLGDLGWTEKRPLQDGQNAFSDIRAGAVASPKIILNP